MRLHLFLAILCWLGTGQRAAHSQQSDVAQATFDSVWVAAAEAGDAGRLDSLVAHDRLRVKPLVQRLIREGLQAELAGGTPAAQKSIRWADDAARRHQRAFGESSLVEAVSYIYVWDAGEKALKLQADSLYDEGTIKRGSADSRPDAHLDYLRALTLYRELGDKLGEGAVLGGLGVIFWYAGEADSVQHYFEEALRIRIATDDRELIGNSYNDLGSVQLGFFRNYDQAIKHYARAAAVREEVGDLVGLARTLRFSASARESLGQLDEAMVEYERAARVSEQAGDLSGAAVALRNAGIAAIDLSRYADALELLHEATEFQEARGDAEGQAEILNWIGVVYRRLGHFEPALESYLRVISLAEETGNELTRAQAVSNIGVVYLSAARPERAARYFEQALPIFQALEDGEGLRAAEINLGSTNLELGDTDGALEHGRRALALSLDADARLDEATSLILIGNALARSDRIDEARAHLNEGIALGRSLKSPNLTWTGLMGLGEAAQYAEAYEEALQHYEAAFEIVERTRGTLQTEEDKAGFLAQQRYLYEDVLHLMNTLHEKEAAAGYDRRAFAFAERAKARAFLDLLAEALANVRSGVDPTLLSRQQLLLSDMSALRERIQQGAGDAEGREAELEAELGVLEDEYDGLVRDLRRSNPRYSSLQYPSPVELESVQTDLLGPNDVLLQYALGDSSASLWVVSRNEAEMYRLSERETIARQVELLRYALERPAAASAETFVHASRRLYEMLVAPAASHVPPGANLIVVPDGILYYVPFEALITADVEPTAGFDDLPYLIEQHAISYGPSASVLHELRQRRRAGGSKWQKGLLAVGDPVFGDEADPAQSQPLDAAASSTLQRLPYTGEEVRSIAALFDAKDADVLLRENATESQLKAHRSLRAYRYIHLATHGLIDEARPDFSGLALTEERGAREDGLLQAAEIFNLELNADLVVLSACQTALGTVVRGEGMVGLTRAFMYAGTPSLLVSLWSVADESTSEYMRHFYEQLLQPHFSKAEAARAAKLALIRDARYAQPFYWAPFILVGDWQ